eukprot:NODE_59_length_25653_cov_0.289622.p3 type:complete len:568 gc:universal NODE_59_length_25653_cov_0.289622:12775-14478(+)
MQTKIISGFSTLLDVYQDKPCSIFGHCLSIENKPIVVGNDKISCIDIYSHYAVTGHFCGKSDMASIHLIDLRDGSIVFTSPLHKYLVKSVKFTLDGQYIISMGGQDDRTLTVTNLSGRAVGGVLISKEIQKQIHTLSVGEGYTFFAAGEIMPKLWKMDPTSKKLQEFQFQMGLLKRVIVSSLITGDLVLCGTLSGDVLKFDLKNLIFKDNGPKKFSEDFARGVKSISLLNEDQILLGGGSGTVAVANISNLNIIYKIDLKSAVYNLKVASNSQIFGIFGDGTIKIISRDLKNVTIFKQSHLQGINCTATLKKTSNLILTGSFKDVFLWDLVNEKVAQTYSVPGKSCQSICVPEDGSEVVTGWDDGCIRVFNPESGTLKYEINNAHKNSTTALNTVILNGNRHIVSGGGEGYLRIWKGDSLVQSLSEHKDKINQLLIENGLCISASDDCSCIIWDLNSFTRKQVFFGDSNIKSVVNLPGCLITFDNKITFWHKKGELLRQISLQDSCTCAYLKNDEFILIGCQSGKVVEMNIITGEYITHYYGQSGISGITGNVSTSIDGSIMKYLTE